LGLEGGPSNRDAVGAAVCVVAGGRRRYGWRLGGGSYQSASDPRLHFGVGTVERIDSVEVTWPSGKVSRYHRLAADTGYLLRECDDAPHRLAGFPEGHPDSGTRP
jgi:enediyne biosynthesis protein E4